MAGGRHGGTPVAVVERGSRADERVVRCRLDGLGDLPVEVPATLVIGAVAGLDLRSAPGYSARPTGCPSTIWSRYSERP